MGRGRSSYACERSSCGTNSCRGTSVIAASTAGSLMPRRRNCFSIISTRCAAYSFFSSMSNRRHMFFPRACFQDLFHLRERNVALILSIVEVWRDAHTGFRAVVDDDLPGEEFPANLVSMRAFHGNRPRTLRWVFRCVHAPAASPGAFDEACGHAHGFLADCSDASFVDNLQSGLARIECRDVWSAVQIAEGVVARIDSAGLECKWTTVRDPPRKRGAQLGAQVFAHVQVGDPRSATEPLEDSAYRKINTQAAHVERNRSRGLKNIENHVRSDAVSPFNNGARVNDAGTAEKNLGNRHKERRFVDSRKQLIQIDTDVVRSPNDLDAGAESALLVVEILNRRKLQLDHHNFVARAAKVETGRNHRMGDRHILVQRNLALARSDQRRDLVAHAYGHFPPPLLPCANSAFRPGIRVGAQPLVHTTRHRTQRIADHVSSAVQDRKFTAPLQKFIHRALLPGLACAIGFFSKQSSIP